MRGLIAASLVGLAVMAGSSAGARPAAAQGKAAEDPNLARAKELFDAGAREYEAGRFEAALQAFEQAFKIVPRDGIMFSMAQAHRRQFTKTNDKGHLVKAVDLYKKYVAKVKSGQRVADAVRALGDLEPLMASVGSDVSPASAEPPKTRIVVNIVVPGTKVSIDGGPEQDPPLNVEVEPGDHKVKLTAPGYFDEERAIRVTAGEIAPANLPQRERPAELSVDVDEGAEVSIDGRFVGEAPLPRAIELSSGRHFVAVLKNGHETYSDEIELARGSKQTFQADLTSTVQRDAAYVVLVSSAALGVAGAVFAGLAFEREAAATTLLDTREERALTRSELEDYDDAREKRSLFTSMAFGFGGGGAAMLLLGTGLLVFDKPRPVAAPSLEGAPARSTPPDETEPKDVESRLPELPPVQVAPQFALSPGFVAVGVSGTF